MVVVVVVVGDADLAYTIFRRDVDDCVEEDCTRGCGGG